MHFLDLTLATPAENLALDEALLEGCETGEIAGSVLRIWEPREYFVVLGRSSKPDTEINLAACRAGGIPVFRRASGGGTVLAGPGCLMYAVVQNYTDPAQRRSITRVHQFVLETIARQLALHVPGVVHVGTSDLGFPGPAGSLVKCSGNSLRMKHQAFLYHGTLLYDFDLARVGAFLAQATREPPYRAGRTHVDFIANLPLSRELLVQSLVNAWQAHDQLTPWPQERMKGIANDKYINTCHGLSLKNLTTEDTENTEEDKRSAIR